MMVARSLSDEEYIAMIEMIRFVQKNVRLAMVLVAFILTMIFVVPAIAPEELQQRLRNFGVGIQVRDPNLGAK